MLQYTTPFYNAIPPRLFLHQSFQYIFICYSVHPNYHERSSTNTTFQKLLFSSIILSKLFMCRFRKTLWSKRMYFRRIFFIFDLIIVEVNRHLFRLNAIFTWRIICIKYFLLLLSAFIIYPKYVKFSIWSSSLFFS